MKMKYLPLIALISGCLYSCDDETPGIGKFVYDNEKITALSNTYNISSQTLRMDSVYSRMATAYLGKYTDPKYGDFSADFIAQINCPENFEFPSTTQGIEETSLQFNYTSYFGDSASVLKLRIDTLNKVIKDDGQDKKLYYTSFNPSDYYDTSATPIAEINYTAENLSVPYKTRKATTYIHNIKADLGNSFGTYIYNKYVTNKNNFKDAKAFINNVLKGFYIHNTQGQGSVLYLNGMALTLKVKYLAKRKSTGVVDSTAYQYVHFLANKEVFTSTRFTNSDKLKDLLGDKTCTYLKTPAGLYTELTLPLDELYEKHQADTLNSVTLSLARYNEEEKSGAFNLSAPPSVLLLRKSDMYTFFEKNSLPNSSTSFLASYDSKANSYNFTQLNRLISQLFKEKAAGSNTTDLDKLVIIPVKLDTKTETSSGQEVTTIIGVSHNIDISSARLFGGNDKLTLKLIYTKAQNK